MAHITAVFCSPGPYAVYEEAHMKALDAYEKVKYTRKSFAKIGGRGLPCF